MGIGENGHVAFNDPPVADFEDPGARLFIDNDAADQLDFAALK